MDFVLLFVFCVLLLSGINAQTQCPQAPAYPQDRRIDKTSLVIATYNAEWLFLTHRNCPGTGCPWSTLEKAQQHLHAVADEIALINADIVNLAEVQDCNVLKALNDILQPRGLKYEPYLITGTDTATGQNMGLLTRIDPIVNLRRTENRVAYPIPSTRCTAPYTGTYGVSKHYYTTFRVEGLPNPLTIFGMHLLAYPDYQDRCIQREAQASVIANLVASEGFGQGHSVVVLGDLNDFDRKVKDAANSAPISQVLDIIRDPVKTLEGDELVNVATYAKVQREVYSNWYDRQEDCNPTPDEFSLIDHLLVSTDLADLVLEGWMDHSYEPLCNTIESDHWPVLVKFNLTKASHF